MIDAIFGPDLVVAVLFILVPLGFLGLSIWAIVDVSSHSSVDFYAAGYSRTAWIVVIGVFTLLYGFGCFIGAYYLIAVRPKVMRVEAARQNPSLVSHGGDFSSPRGFCPSCGSPFACADKYCSQCGVAIPN